MKTPEELKALKEEELEQVAGGGKNSDSGYDPIDPAKECSNYLFNPYSWIESCTLPVTDRTQEKCKGCRVNLILK